MKRGVLLIFLVFIFFLIDNSNAITCTKGGITVCDTPYYCTDDAQRTTIIESIMGSGWCGCGGVCTSTCPSSGAKQCSGTYWYQTCGDYNNDGCLEWNSPAITCPVVDGKQQECQNGQCITPSPTASCTDGIQNQGETSIDCGGPCPACQGLIPYCGDGTCNGAETCGLTNNAPECNSDCGACQPIISCPAQCDSSKCNPPNCLCSSGKGDCDNHDDCESGLVCCNNVGANYGCSSGTDICLTQSECNSLSCSKNQGSICYSPQNACGQTNTGTVQCDGTCNALTPANPSYYGQACGCGGTKDCNNNCIGGTPLQTFYRDADSDAYGDISITTTACSKPNGYSTNNQDCNDANVNINPGKSEICTDGIDNNCNGLIDCKDSACTGKTNVGGKTCCISTNQCSFDQACENNVCQVPSKIGNPTCCLTYTECLAAAAKNSGNKLAWPQSVDCVKNGITERPECY